MRAVPTMMGRFFVVVLALLTGCSAPAPPDVHSVRAAHRPSEAYLTDRHGELLHVRRVDFGARRLAWTPLAEISPALRRAIIAAEDRRFEDHRGVDWRALAAATWGYLTGKPSRGASTITMQVVALLDEKLAPAAGRRSIGQKVSQVRAALALERAWSKKDILEAYLNRVDFRGELSGIAAAARGLFGKDPSGLDEAESAVLAALLPAPNQGPGPIARRACAVATTARFAVACTTVERTAEIAVSSLGTSVPDIALAPHVARRLLQAPGDRVRTTIEAHVQRLVASVLAAQLAEIAGRNVRDAAAIVLDNASGDVLAWVGSAGPASTAGAVDGVLAHRQAGSTLKPFLYGLALERGYLTAASILEDSPVELETATGLYLPQNYDRDFKGPVSVRTALAASLNVPAVRALVLVGVETLRERLHELGYAAITEAGEYYGYSLALGSAEVSLAEQANAYRTLANGGLYSPLRLTPDDPSLAPRRVLSADAAYIVADILGDRAGRAPTFGLANPLATRYWSAVKTGTSKDMRDNWCIGFSRRHTVAVWVGNFEGDSMQEVSGVSGAAPAWRAIMNSLHANGFEPAPAPPPGVIGTDVRFEPAIEPPRRELFLAGTEMFVVQVADPGRRPRIVEPPNGAIIALDPDIPLANQRVLVSARPGTPTSRLELDGEPLGSASTAIAWTPTPGAHVLRLVDATANRLDEVRFLVR